MLDLFCCEGGASMGYHRAGSRVYGIDLFRHRNSKGKLVGFRRERYPFSAYQGDALLALAVLLIGEALPFTSPDGTVEWLKLSDFDLIAASPPCQLYSVTANAHKNSDHPDLVGPTRDALIATGKPYVIENVIGAPLCQPLMLCGSEFDLTATDDDGRTVRLQRHRLFESNVFLMGAGGCRHDMRIPVAGVYGNGCNTHERAKARAGGYTPPNVAVRASLMGIDWMSRNGLSQAIPPSYTTHIGLQLIDHLRAERAA